MIFNNKLLTTIPSLSKQISGLLLTLCAAHAAAAPNAPEPDINPQPDVPATVAGCPDYSAVLNLPTFTFPQKRKFKNWGSYFFTHYSPYHMIHDEVVNADEKVTITGKFDYNRVFHKDLEKEYIHAYIYGTGMTDWKYLGKHETNWDGKVYVDIDGMPEGEYIVRMVVEGDLTTADGFISVVPTGQQAVLFDIDGTLTLNDFELLGDLVGSSSAQAWPYAKETVQAYIDKGYRVIFLTARPYWGARDTREWFTDYIQLPQWQLSTNENGGGDLLNVDIEGYKRDYLKHLLQDQGLDIVRAYGNADTDIGAYIDAGISKDDIWIIGENAGKSGTQPIYGDYSDHYFSFVQNTPEANCRTLDANTLRLLNSLFQDE